MKSTMIMYNDGSNWNLLCDSFFSQLEISSSVLSVVTIGEAFGSIIVPVIVELTVMCTCHIIFSRISPAWLDVEIQKAIRRLPARLLIRATGKFGNLNIVGEHYLSQKFGTKSEK